MLLLAYHRACFERTLFLPARKKPRNREAFLVPLVPRSLGPCLYCRFAIKASSADFGGRVNVSGNVASGSSTMFSRSMKFGFCVSM